MILMSLNGEITISVLTYPLYISKFVRNLIVSLLNFKIIKNSIDTIERYGIKTKINKINRS